jgi:hypothetical protein
VRICRHTYIYTGAFCRHTYIHTQVFGSTQRICTKTTGGRNVTTKSAVSYTPDHSLSERGSPFPARCGTRSACGREKKGGARGGRRQQPTAGRDSAAGGYGHIHVYMYVCVWAWFCLFVRLFVRLFVARVCVCVWVWPCVCVCVCAQACPVGARVWGIPRRGGESPTWGEIPRRPRKPETKQPMSPGRVLRRPCETPAEVLRESWESRFELVFSQRFLRKLPQKSVKFSG